MAIYLVRAWPKLNILGDLKKRLELGEISKLKPFGNSLDYSLKNAKLKEDGYAYWVEEDYCSPPLKMEIESVLNQYFDDIQIVEEMESMEKGWNKVKESPFLWEKVWQEFDINPSLDIENFHLHLSSIK